MVNGMNEYPLMEEGRDAIPLFYPHVPSGAIQEVTETLEGRWIGQGPKVEEFEQQMANRFLTTETAVAVGSGTDALHLAYILAGIKSGDEVLAPVFTCTATNIPLLYLGANIRFVDVDPITLNLCLDDLRKKITPNTRAIVCVDYGGVPNHYKELRELASEYNIPIISDAAHSLGSVYQGKYACTWADFSIFSFQAIKTLTTGDGGMLIIKDSSLAEQARRIRWFGIDRQAKQGGIWENDITEIGFKYQMNDIAAGIGLAGLRELDAIIEHRQNLIRCYEKNLKQDRVSLVGFGSVEEGAVPWLATILVDSDRKGLMDLLRRFSIESAQVHYRNDRYKIFSNFKVSLPKMDEVEDKYLVLPLHTKISESDVLRVCEVVNRGW